MASAICGGHDQNRREAANQKTTASTQIKFYKNKHSPGGAKRGHASLMRPNRPLPTLPFADMPLRRNPNAAAAIIAA
jgi:hypothetical protein